MGVWEGSQGAGNHCVLLAQGEACIHQVGQAFSYNMKISRVKKPIYIGWNKKGVRNPNLVPMLPKEPLWRLCPEWAEMQCPKCVRNPQQECAKSLQSDVASLLKLELLQSLCAGFSLESSFRQVRMSKFVKANQGRRTNKESYPGVWELDRRLEFRLVWPPPGMDLLEGKSLQFSKSQHTEDASGDSQQLRPHLQRSEKTTFERKSCIIPKYCNPKTFFLPVFLFRASNSGLSSWLGGCLSGWASRGWSGLLRTEDCKSGQGGCENGKTKHGLVSTCAFLSFANSMASEELATGLRSASLTPFRLFNLSL